MRELSADFARSILRYEDETGLLYWRSRSDIPPRVDKRMAGRVAGCLCKRRGYILVGIQGVDYLAHRLVWLIVTGEFPADGLDHKDGNKQNNRFGNLRPSDQSQNMSNRGKQRNNKSGYKGVYFDKSTGRWVANIMVQKRTIYLGRYNTPEDAARAYNVSAKRHFGEFAKLNDVPANNNFVAKTVLRKSKI